MKVRVTVNPEIEEERADIEVRQLTSAVSRVVNELQHLDFKLVGTYDDKKYLLEFGQVITCYASEKKVFALTANKREYQLGQTLSALTECLPANFLRVSHSEVVNADQIKAFDFTFSGKVKIIFKNGTWTFSSRSYLKKIKEFFKL